MPALQPAPQITPFLMGLLVLAIIGAIMLRMWVVKNGYKSIYDRYRTYDKPTQFDIGGESNAMFRIAGGNEPGDHFEPTTFPEDQLF